MNEPRLRFKADDEKPFPDWKKSKFSDVFDNINNSTFSRDCLNYVDGNVKYIHYGDILTTFDSTVNAEASNVPYVNKDINCQKYQLLSDGDIIVADTAEDDTVGKSVEITNTSNVKLISGLHTIACRPKLKFASGYLGYYMNSKPYHNQLRPYMQGIKVTSISKANIALTNVSIPSLPEQQKIASLFTELDDLIQSAEKELEGYRELKQGMLQKMFPKNGKTTPEIRFPEFTGDWEQRKLEDIYDSIGNAFVGTSTPYYVEQGHFYLESNNVKDGQINHNSEVFINDEFYEKQKDKWLHTGDMVMVQSGHVGHAAVIPEELNNTAAHALIMFRNPKEEIEPYFLNYEYQTDKAKKKIENITKGNTIKHILSSDMQEFVVDTPKYEEQKVIADYFRNIDRLIALQQKELDGYKELKKGLLQQMFC